MKVAAAQFRPNDSDTAANIATHVQFARLAAQKGAHLIAFPEMSLTGYHREKAEQMAFEENDERLRPLRDLAMQENIVIIAGAPVKSKDHLHIAALLMHPDGSLHLYTKQYLHTGEEAFFVPGNHHNPFVTLDDETIGMAICADITHAAHPQQAAQHHTTLYVAGIFYTPAGLAEAYHQMENYARTYDMNILMANFTGASHRFEAGGKSAFWDREGRLTAALDDHSEGLLIVEKKQNHWHPSA